MLGPINFWNLATFWSRVLENIVLKTSAIANIIGIIIIIIIIIIITIIIIIIIL
jgi:hypothetical protein